MKNALNTNTKVILFVLVFIMLMYANQAYAGSNISYSFSYSTPNSQVMIASGGVVLIGLTIGIFQGSLHRADNDVDTGTMYASLLTFDMTRNTHKMSLPAIAYEDNIYYMPIINWRF